MVQNAYADFLNQLKTTAAQRRHYFCMRLTTKSKALVHLLHEVNVVRRFYKISPTHYCILPAYSRRKKSLRQIQTYTRANGRHRFTLNTIRILNLNTPHSYYILETDRGLMTHKTALKDKIGGLLLVVVC